MTQLTQNIGKLGIIAGGGKLPSHVVHACVQQDIPFTTVGFKHQPQPQEVDVHKKFALGAVSKILSFLKQQGVTHVLMAGFLSKPSLFDLRFDKKAMEILRHVGRKHDNDLLTAVVAQFVKEGFVVVGAHELVPELLAPLGLIAGPTPSSNQLEDIALGFTTIKALGNLDIGQACVVKDGVVLGVEAVEGTNMLIDRCAALRGKKHQGGVLVKGAKPEQTMKVDLPTIGPETINRLGKAGYSGLAVQAGKTLMVDPQQMAALAAKYNLFVIAMEG